MYSYKFYHIGLLLSFLGILFSLQSCDAERGKNGNKNQSLPSVSEVQAPEFKKKPTHTVEILWPCENLTNTLRQEGFLKGKDSLWHNFKQDNPNEWQVAVDLINLSNMEDYKQGNLSDDELWNLFDCRISKYIYDTHRKTEKSPENEIESYCRIVKSFVYEEEGLTEEEDSLMKKLDEHLGHFKLFHFEIKILTNSEISENVQLDSLIQEERNIWFDFSKARKTLYSKLVLGKESCWGKSWSSLQESMLESFDLEQDHQRENLIYDLYCVLNSTQRRHEEIIKAPTFAEIQNANKRVINYINQNNSNSACSYSASELKNLLYKQNELYDKYISVRKAITVLLSGDVKKVYEQSTNYIASTEYNYLYTITTNDVDFGHTEVEEEEEIEDDMDNEIFEYD
ncbi:MAG: hypothetical protein M0P12_07390 [Paludibacteraceae bacterium]|nr:hypothetical protein [Paludibacteraceae bacterium]HOU68781.1 hypothetical protein [Paludibacteraceae bacterium]HQF50863.1 hypothetical protein [Paludibacteraceae bacterium]HQJ90203.1 hypothetical protein [Paludibacteraceae bacterium]